LHVELQKAKMHNNRKNFSKRFYKFLESPFYILCPLSWADILSRFCIYLLFLYISSDVFVFVGVSFFVFVTVQEGQRNYASVTVLLLL